jgi:GxxExxY protein
MSYPSKKIFQPVPAEVEPVGKVILDAAYAVHTELGPGLLESLCQVAMKHFVESSSVSVETETNLPLLFRGVKPESGLRLDIPVDHCVIAELK